MRTRKRRWIKPLVFVAVLAALGAVWRFTDLADVVTPENAREWAGQLRAMPAAPVVLVLSFTLAALVMFPRPLLTLTAIVAFGTWRGITYSGIGIMIAAMVFFYAGRFVPHKWVVKLGGGDIASLERLFREHGVMSIFVLNMVPTPPFSVQGIIAGACRLRTWQYVAGSFLGMLPTLLGWAFFGHQLASSLEDPSSISPGFMVAVAATLFALTFFVRRWYTRYSAG